MSIPDFMRFFIALEIPENSRQEICDIQAEVEKLIPEAKITGSNKLHLTIAFIGDQPDRLKDNLIQMLREAAKGIPPFQVTPGYIDGFPHLHTANTLWIGVKDDIDKLYLLRHRIKDGLKDLQLLADQRRFVPHIAIAKLGNDFQLSESVEIRLEELMNRSFSPIEVSSVKLFESIPDQGLHTHNTLAEIWLA